LNKVIDRNSGSISLCKTLFTAQIVLENKIHTTKKIPHHFEKGGGYFLDFWTRFDHFPRGV
jgi:hypothetical protein